jgi:hypothetical protein
MLHFLLRGKETKFYCELKLDNTSRHFKGIFYKYLNIVGLYGGIMLRTLNKQNGEPLGILYSYELMVFR